MDTPTPIKVAGALMMIGALWNLVFALGFAATWIVGIYTCCLAVLPLVAAAHAVRTGWYGWRVFNGERLPEAILVVVVEFFLGIVALCGFGATAPVLAAVLALGFNREWLDGADAPADGPRD